MFLVGEAGLGKTTMLECISGLLSPDDGSIILGSRKLLDTLESQNVSSRERRIIHLALRNEPDGNL